MVILPEIGKNFVIRAWFRLFQWFDQSSYKHENNHSALLAFHSNVLVTSNVLNSTTRSFLWHKFRKHRHTYLHICSGLATHWNTSQTKPHWKRNTGRQLRSRIRMVWTWPAFWKITGFLPCCCCCLMLASACKSRLSAYLLPQSGEHLASGWHLTAFSCSKKKGNLKDNQSSQDVLPRLLFLAEEIVLSIFLS